jgi:hypothetical protein
MANRQVRAGVVAHLTGLNGSDQMAYRELGPMCVAIQIRDFGWIRRMTATVKQLRDQGGIRVNWPGLDDVQVLEFSSRVMPIVSYGDPLFEPDIMPFDLRLPEEETASRLNLCERKTMSEVSEYSSQRTEYVELLSDSKNFSKTERGNMCEEFATQEKQRCDNAGAGVAPQIITLAVREWLFLFEAPADKWD